MFRKEAPTWFILRSFLFWSTWFPCENAGSLRIPVKGELVYDTMSKTADVRISPHMCPPWVLGLLCSIVNNPTASITEQQHSSKASKSPSFSSSSPTSSSSTTPTTSPSTSSTKGTLSTAVTTETSTSKPTKGPTSRSSTPTSSSTATTEMKTTTGATEESAVGFLEAGLEEHNKYRKIHESASLTISPMLNRDANAAAKRIASQGKLIHTDDNELNGQGENIGKICDSDLTPEELIRRVVGIWYKEVCNYDFSNPSWSHSTGHFTQLVWASTKQLGLGWAMGKDDTCYYVVGRYFREGNIETRLEENVKKGSFDRSYCNAKRSGVASRQFSNFVF